MFSTDQFLNRVQKPGYNCFDFAREVWLALMGEDIGIYFPKLQGDFSSRKASHSGLSRFRRLKAPESPCFVVFQLGRETPHIGVYINGKVLHLPNVGNAEYKPVDVARRYFKDIRYYK